MAHKDLDGILEKFSIGDERLLGAGAESRVYALSDDLVLRVYRGAAGVWCWGYNGYGQLGNNDRLAGCVIPRISERARTLGNRHYRLVPSGSTDQLLVSPMVIRRAERAGGVPAVIASRQDCAMLAGGPFLGCAGGPLP